VNTLKEENMERREFNSDDRRNNSGGRGNFGVGILVDTDFNSFLNDIKMRLSDRVKLKEKEVDNTLKIDLQKKRKNLGIGMRIWLGNLMRKRKLLWEWKFSEERERF